LKLFNEHYLLSFLNNKKAWYFAITCAWGSRSPVQQNKAKPTPRRERLPYSLLYIELSTFQAQVIRKRYLFIKNIFPNSIFSNDIN